MKFELISNDAAGKALVSVVLPLAVKESRIQDPVDAFDLGQARLRSRGRRKVDRRAGRAGRTLLLGGGGGRRGIRVGAAQWTAVVEAQHEPLPVRVITVPETERVNLLFETIACTAVTAANCPLSVLA